MAKSVDISDKLSFDDNPVLKMCGIEVEVNASAGTMLKVIGTFSDDNEMKAVSETLDLLFSPEDKEKICSLEKKGKKLDSKSLMIIINEAISLVTGETGEGEA